MYIDVSLRLSDVTARVRARDGITDVVRVREKGKNPMMSFLKALKTIKR